MFDDPDICPPWWPKIIWQLHFPWRIPHSPPPNPVNYPLAIDDIMSHLAVHTFSYKMIDQAAATQIRNLAVQGICDTTRKLDELHEEGLRQRAQDAKPAG